MAKQAEAAGLSFGWTAWRPTKLDVTSPEHDSSSGLFSLDRYNPILRKIGMKKCAVKRNKSLYEALDENGQPTTAMKRENTSERDWCSDDDKGTCSPAP